MIDTSYPKHHPFRARIPKILVNYVDNTRLGKYRPRHQRLGGLMRTWPAHLFALVCLMVPMPLSAQQPASSSPTSGPQTPQAASIIQQSIAAITGGLAVTDVTMTGTTAVSISANGQEGTAPASSSNPATSTVTFVATASGQGQSTAVLAAGTRTEIRDISSGFPTLTETGTDGVTDTVTTQSALSPHPGWFYPAFVLNTGLTSANYASSYVGQETWNGAVVQHIAVWLLPGSSPTSTQFSQQVTQHDIYLDPASLLPVAMTFTVHPYDPTNPNRQFVPYRGNAVDSLQQVTFSDYQQVQGRSVAFHIHTTMQAGQLTIVTDTQFSSISFNTGATVAAN
jgi:hypothetical protein